MMMSAVALPQLFVMMCGVLVLHVSNYSILVTIGTSRRSIMAASTRVYTHMYTHTLVSVRARAKFAMVCGMKQIRRRQDGYDHTKYRGS